ncbi:hypothetical protein TSAR_014221 [Trichomalopsis sarcophagae]|uniref:Uncharacterized protein n=1 Tax=Trichomalopsis sarcophagae TaxID=543379 RepID=A0A232FMD4_9HYME|nr:hypothetical protein TSAR_014221 [Trichomalopsis sarcophagae]
MFAPVLKMSLEARDFIQAAINVKKTKRKDVTEKSNSTNNSIQESEHPKKLERDLISPDILASFKQAETDGVWNGDVAYVALFQSWLKLRKIPDTEITATISNESSGTDGSSLADHEMSENIAVDMIEDQMLDNVWNSQVIDITTESVEGQMPDANSTESTAANISSEIVDEAM